MSKRLSCGTEASVFSLCNPNCELCVFMSFASCIDVVTSDQCDGNQCCPGFDGSVVCVVRVVCVGPLFPSSLFSLLLCCGVLWCALLLCVAVCGCVVCGVCVVCWEREEEGGMHRTRPRVHVQNALRVCACHTTHTNTHKHTTTQHTTPVQASNALTNGWAKARAFWHSG